MIRMLPRSSHEMFVSCIACKLRRLLAATSCRHIACGAASHRMQARYDRAARNISLRCHIIACGRFVHRSKSGSDLGARSTYTCHIACRWARGSVLTWLCGKNRHGRRHRRCTAGVFLAAGGTKRDWLDLAAVFDADIASTRLEHVLPSLARRRIGQCVFALVENDTVENRQQTVVSSDRADASGSRWFQLESTAPPSPPRIRASHYQPRVTDLSAQTTSPG